MVTVKAAHNGRSARCWRHRASGEPAACIRQERNGQSAPPMLTLRSEISQLSLLHARATNAASGSAPAGHSSRSPLRPRGQTTSAVVPGLPRPPQPSGDFATSGSQGDVPVSHGRSGWFPPTVTSGASITVRPTNREIRTGSIVMGFIVSGPFGLRLMRLTSHGRRRSLCRHQGVWRAGPCSPAGAGQEPGSSWRTTAGCIGRTWARLSGVGGT